MSISKTGCSITITKEDLRMQYLQGFKECAEMKNETEKEIRADERVKMIKYAEKLLDKIAPDKVAEIKCDDGEIRNRPLIDIAKVYEILEQMKGDKE